MARLRTAENITDLVGETPMLRLRRIVPEGAASVFAKLEYISPGGSVKDRAAIGMIQKAEKEGRLKPGSTIVEATAGNTGIGLALIGVNKGYRVVVCVPEKFAEEKVKSCGPWARRSSAHPMRQGCRVPSPRPKNSPSISPVPSPHCNLRILPTLNFIMTQQLLKSLSRCRANSMPWSWASAPEAHLPAS